jgi:hypothetical protein
MVEVAVAKVLVKCAVSKGMRAGQPLHESRDAAVDQRLENEVEMVRHYAVTKDFHPLLLPPFMEENDERSIIAAVVENLSAVDRSIHDMRDCAGW